MQISNIALLHQQDTCQLQAEVHTGQDGEPFLLWFRFPLDWAHYVDPANGDPFLLALLLPAMKAGDCLELPVAVSSRLASSLPDMQAIHRLWDPLLKQVELHAPIRREPLLMPRLPSHVGLFFSLGVDSFYSLLKNADLHPDDDETITDLITVNGFDISPVRGNGSLFPIVLHNSHKVGAAIGKHVLPVETNVKELGERFQLDWGIYCGSAMASVGLALQGAFRKITCASGFTYADPNIDGTNPFFAPLWSTQRLTFVIDGCAVTRLEKILCIAESALVQETLRVCWHNPGNAYNCGRCPKCLHTMVGLHIAGALDKCTTFPSYIDLDLIATMPGDAPTDEDVRRVWQNLVNALGKTEADLKISAAIQTRLGPARIDEYLEEQKQSKQQLGAQLIEKEQVIAKASAHIDEQQRFAEALLARLAVLTSEESLLRSQVRESQQAAELLAAQLKEKQEALSLIYGSRLWKIGMAYRSLVARVARMGRRIEK
jgi:hypothetical protein